MESSVDYYKGYDEGYKDGIHRNLMFVRAIWFAAGVVSTMLMVVVSING